MGLHEVRDKTALSGWLKFGKFLGDPSKLPWCGDAVETCIVKTLPDEPVPSNPFFAQNWRAFGMDAGGPLVGAIGVIRWTANSGHVGIVVGYDAAKRRVFLMGATSRTRSRSARFLQASLSRSVGRRPSRFADIRPCVRIALSRLITQLPGDAQKQMCRAGS